MPAISVFPLLPEDLIPVPSSFKSKTDIVEEDGEDNVRKLTLWCTRAMVAVGSAKTWY